MSNIKLAIIYYSSTGTNYQLAKWASESAAKAGADVRILKVMELAPKEAIAQNPKWKKHLETTKGVPTASMDDLEWADAIIFSTPTRYGNVAAQMKLFMDSTGQLWAEGKLANKVVSAMSSAQNPHGGQESTVLSLYNTMHHWGAIIVAPGYTNKAVDAAGGNPYGTTVSVDEKSGEMKEDVKAAVYHQAKRTVEIATMLKNGNNHHKTVETYGQVLEGSIK